MEDLAGPGSVSDGEVALVVDRGSGRGRCQAKETLPGTFLFTNRIEEQIE